MHCWEFSRVGTGGAGAALETPRETERICALHPTLHTLSELAAIPSADLSGAAYGLRFPRVTVTRCSSPVEELEQLESLLGVGICAHCLKTFHRAPPCHPPALRSSVPIKSPVGFTRGNPPPSLSPPQPSDGLMVRRWRLIGHFPILTFFDSTQCLMVRRWRLIGHFPISTFLIRLSVRWPGGGA